jgi:hypothetical protein
MRAKTARSIPPMEPDRAGKVLQFSSFRDVSSSAVADEGADPESRRLSLDSGFAPSDAHSRDR